MFERFTDTARHVVVQAQEDARQLGHSYIGCEHLLLAAAAAAEPASAVLRDQGVTPERIKAEILRTSRAGPDGRPAGRPGPRGAGFHRHRPGRRPRPDRSGVRPGRPHPGPPGCLPAPAASLGEGPAGRADAPPASPSRPPQRPPACRSVPATSRFCRARSRRPYPVHAAREEDPGALAARGGGAARQLHRRPAPHPGPAGAEGRHGTGDPVGPRRTGRIAARRHPRPLPQGELIRTPTWPPLPRAPQRGPDSARPARASTSATSACWPGPSPTPRGNASSP